MALRNASESNDQKILSVARNQPYYERNRCSQTPLRLGIQCCAVAGLSCAHSGVKASALASTGVLQPRQFESVSMSGIW